MAKAFKLVSVQEADERLAQIKAAFGTERLPLGKELAGRRLAQPIIADRDFPPYNRATMDGFAVRMDDTVFQEGTELEVVGEQAAGDKPIETTRDGSAIRVTTGAMLGEGINAVIPKEHTVALEKNTVRLITNANAGQYIHFRASDATAGSALIPAGSILDAAMLAVAASVGTDCLEVARLPRIMLLTTGDEVVTAGTSPREEQIRSSNGIMIETLLHKSGLSCDRYHCEDNRAALCERLEDFQKDYDLLITTGGVSQGEKDYLPELFEEAGITPYIHGIKQRPGKPLWFGQSKAAKTVFGLPGNPLSAHLCMMRYVLPWLRQQLGNAILPRWVLTESAVANPLPLTRFLPVVVRANEATGQLFATPLTPNTSGDMVTVLGTHGWVELPPETTLAAGARLLLHEEA